jgi:Calx-beta domain
LLANGTQDPGFSAASISAQFGEVTALTVGPTGSIFVAGRERTGFAGATVVRLLADGALDPLYGRAGSSRIELNALRSRLPVINDMRALGNDALVVGGNGGPGYLGTPFVARLLGNAAGGGPGVLSMRQDQVLGTEQAGKATISVRRIGGTKGAIAVSYAARDVADRAPASKGQDYTAIAGRLTWADGDDSDREIVVPIASDTLAEPPEFFELALDTPEGGAGLGAYGTEIEIAGEGYPAGLLTIRLVQSLVSESGQADFQVNREPYSAGIVTVTVRVAGGSATPGQDFASPGDGTAWRDVVITFQDNETQKLVPVPVRRDGKDEWAESFTLELVSPTGGAALGAQSQATVTILDGGGNSSGGSGGGGGGALGWLATLLLGLAGGLRRLLARDRRLQPSA